MLLGRAERQAAHGAKLLFELAGDAGVDGEVTGVVRAWGKFVDQELAGGRNEEFDAEHPDDVQAVEYATRDCHRLARNLCRNVGGRGRDIQDMVRMHVLDNTEMGEVPVLAPDSDDRDLAGEVYER